MATLEKIRNNAKWLLVGFVGLALFAFIFDGFFRSGSTFYSQKRENIATVDGQAIKIQDYQQLVEERTNLIKARNQGMSITEDQTNQIRQMVLNEAIDKILLNDECEKVGFAVSQEELSDMIMGRNISPMIQQMPEFRNPQTGQFDKNNLLRFLQQIETDDYSQIPEEMIPQIIAAKKSWLSVEQQVTEQKLQGKLGSLLAAAITPNKLDLQASYDDSKVSVDLDYAMQSYISVSDDAVSVSDAEIAKLYNERKNTFKQEEVKIIDYIAVPILPSEQDYQSVLDRMEKVKTRLTESEYPGDVVMENNSEVPYLDAFVAYSQLTNSQKHFVDNSAIHAVEGPVLENNTYSMYKLEGETIAPDSIKLNVLALPATDDEKFVTHLGDSLIQVIKGGKTFADMAQEVTGGRSDGSAGWQTEASLLQQTQNDVAFKKAAFTAPLNETQIIKSSMGSYLVQVVERTASVKKYKIATVQIPVVPSQTTKTRLYNDLNQYIASHHSLATFKDSAATAGYNIQKEVEVGKKQMGLSNIQNSRQVIQWAFKSDKGAISDIYECQNQEYFVVAAVEGGLKEGFRPLASVSDILKRELINDKKAEKIIADLKAKNMTTLDEYAAAMNTNSQSVNFLTFATQNISGGIGVEPVINVEATVAPVGKVSGPYKGNRGVYVINVTNRREGETPFDANMQKQTVQMQYGYRLYQLFQSNQLLKEGAKIEDHYDRFF